MIGILRIDDDRAFSIIRIPIDQHIGNSLGMQSRLKKECAEQNTGGEIFHGKHYLVREDSEKLLMRKRQEKSGSGRKKVKSICLIVETRGIAFFLLFSCENFMRSPAQYAHARV